MQLFIRNAEGQVFEIINTDRFVRTVVNHSTKEILFFATPGGNLSSPTMTRGGEAFDQIREQIDRHAKHDEIDMFSL